MQTAIGLSLQQAERAIGNAQNRAEKQSPRSTGISGLLFSYHHTLISPVTFAADYQMVHTRSGSKRHALGTSRQEELKQ
jgi:hypothetical protein